jgi:carboxyl-terminal processing protease
MFFPTRVPMGYVIRRDGRRSVERSRGPEVFSGPLAVLVGRHSHSSAEVFAHVMQTHARAVVVGHPTPGNVLGSRRFRLPDGGYLRLSITDFRGLDDRQLEGRGVRPDIEVERNLPQPAGTEANDVAISAALRAL